MRFWKHFSGKRRVARGNVSAITRLRFSSRVRANVEAIDARGGRASDPRNHGAQVHRHEAGLYPDRGHLRKMRRTKSHLGRKGRDPRQIRLQAMRTPARDVLRVLHRHCEEQLVRRSSASEGGSKAIHSSSFRAMRSIEPGMTRFPDVQLHI